MSHSEITFFANPQSRSRIVRWMLEELNVPYKTEVLEYGEAMKSEAYLAINPMGKVPAILHNGQVITECAAICAYLADAFSDRNLAPPLDDRGAYYRWMFFSAGPLEAAITNKALGFEVPLERQRMAGYGHYDLAVETLAMAVSRTPYIAGDLFSAADVYVGSHVIWGIDYKTLPERKEFVEYAEKLRNRPACLRANELDDALTRKSSS